MALLVTEQTGFGAGMEASGPGGGKQRWQGPDLPQPQALLIEVQLGSSQKRVAMAARGNCLVCGGSEYRC